VEVTTNFHTRKEYIIVRGRGDTNLIVQNIINTLQKREEEEAHIREIKRRNMQIHHERQQLEASGNRYPKNPKWRYLAEIPTE
jgi:hypothetical protein